MPSRKAGGWDTDARWPPTAPRLVEANRQLEAALSVTQRTSRNALLLHWEPFTARIALPRGSRPATFPPYCGNLAPGRNFFWESRAPARRYERSAAAGLSSIKGDGERPFCGRNIHLNREVEALCERADGVPQAAAREDRGEDSVCQLAQLRIAPLGVLQRLADERLRLPVFLLERSLRAGKAESSTA
jgi:hypothetical protein